MINEKETVNGRLGKIVCIAFGIIFIIVAMYGIAKNIVAEKTVATKEPGGSPEICQMASAAAPFSGLGDYSGHSWSISEFRKAGDQGWYPIFFNSTS